MVKRYQNDIISALFASNCYLFTMISGGLMEKCVDIFVASYARAKETEYLAVIFYKGRFRLFRGAVTYGTHEAAQLRAAVLALEGLRHPVAAVLYLNSKKLATLLAERLGGYICLDNIDRQADAELLKRYYAQSKRHRIALSAR
jgi:hypothetical protein